MFTLRRANSLYFTKKKTAHIEGKKEENSIPSADRGWRRVFFSAKRTPRKSVEAIYPSRGGHACVKPHPYIHRSMHEVDEEEVEGETERGRGWQSSRCHAGCAKGDEGDGALARPLLVGAIHPLRASLSRLSSRPSVPPSFQLPRWQAGGRTSFPRLTAGRRGEGNENNEIQRSSVTVCSSRLLTRICIT